MKPRKNEKLDGVLKDANVVNEYIKRSEYLITLNTRDKKLMAAAFNAGYEYRMSLEGRVFG